MTRWRRSILATGISAACGSALLLSWGTTGHEPERLRTSSPPTTTNTVSPASEPPAQPNDELADSAGPFVTYNTYPGAAQAQWGKYSIALERNGSYYLLSAGHVAGKVGAGLQLGSSAPSRAVVSHSTRTWDPEFSGPAGGSGPDMSMIDTGTALIAPFLQLSTAPADAVALERVQVPSIDGTEQISLPRVAEISSVAGDLGMGTVVCQTGADWYASEYTAAAGNVRCGRLIEPCPTSSATCRFVDLDTGVPAVAVNDSGNPVWVPRMDGTIEILGIVYAAGCAGVEPGCRTGLLTRVDAYLAHNWTSAEVLPGKPLGPGGRIVVVG
ncbi:hypothetical protein [Rhodococcus sp. OK302]|uniref:hypothetical protein n=1 Tax=Rhodococcus sp. OK302 TaxID=1882769 RepID=UPI000B93F963|nr:hypothetical protein [Rhodococcus sp. OK302]OYD61142.1 hypothetical protein BDB13_6087 [Rhodococcus sp. OK302]